MAKFNAEQYKKELKTATSVDACRKVPVPRLKRGQNYVFISYSHRDYKKVFCDLADLYECGVPFWYDRGLPAGKNWDDVVREKMTDPRCSGVIFFLSNSLFLSQSIQTEIKIAYGEDNEKDATNHQLSYFSVNLTEKAPSQILTDTFGEKAFTDVEDKMLALNQWACTLAKAFPDKATYLPFSSATHKTDLIEQIGVCFNISVTTNLYDFGGARFVCGNGTIEFENGSQYSGEFCNGVFEGKGTMRYSGGSIYEGNWKNGKRHGDGTMKYPDGTVYSGEWKNHERHGNGTYVNSRKTYTGQWENGLPGGMGKCVYASGTVYEGQWKNGNSHGKGKSVYADGAVYEGDWKEGKWNGTGRLTEPSGVIFEGNWKNGKMHGKGKFIAPDVFTYDGDWKNGKRCGQCTFIRADGHKYVGGWGEHGSHGQGTYFYPDGASRSGIWDGTNLIRGKGVLRYEDNSWYDGEIRNNQRHGRGRYTLADGTIQEGVFCHDAFTG